MRTNRLRRTIEGLRVCLDCALITENGPRGLDLEPGVLDRYDRATRAHVGFDLVIEDQTDDFSRSRCDYCYSTLAGVRFGATLISRR